MANESVQETVNNEVNTVLSELLKVAENMKIKCENDLKRSSELGVTTVESFDRGALTAYEIMIDNIKRLIKQ